MQRHFGCCTQDLQPDYSPRIVTDLTIPVDDATRRRLEAQRLRDTEPEMTLRRELHRLGRNGEDLPSFLDEPDYENRDPEASFHHWLLRRNTDRIGGLRS